MRVREVVTRSGTQFRGKFPSLKLNRMVHWESTFERDAILHLEYHPLVVSYQEQPTIEHYYDAAGECHQYVPDFRALFENGDEVFIEIKPERVLSRRDVRERLAAVAKRFEEQGRRFRVMTEKDIRRQPLFGNLRALHRAAKVRRPRGYDQQLVLDLEPRLKWTFKELVEGVGSTQGALRLIRMNHLEVDLEATLADHANVWLVGSEGGANVGFRL
jgi:TnsA endonuclease N terminal